MPAEIVDIEKELLSRIAEGDEQAFSCLFYKFLPVLQPFITRFTKSDYATEEVIQNIFIRVWLNRDKLEEVNNVRAWLYKYASNECLNYLRAKQQKEKVMDTIAANTVTYSNATLDSVRLNEINTLISKAVDNLSAQRRRIYLLSRNEGLTIPQIAAELQLSPNTVKNALVTSLGIIRRYLADRGYTFSLFFVLFLIK
ncbi:RNA polymerase sigma factor [Pedobacter sp. BS3]|uniref:RNA polymerase sigma factor n=1 Tax=Pedobacter sp. BS3 TaxID=2567937 RepID=UPI0016592B0D|nr:RNA polymerase sigma-70 factor [Pedobacter sp. BS3]